jgi:hypothetical protein
VRRFDHAVGLSLQPGVHQSVGIRHIITTSLLGTHSTMRALRKSHDTRMLGKMRQSLDRRCRSKSANASHAQRALGAIDGNAIPINPARAIRARSVSVPQRLIVSEAASASAPPTHDTVQPGQSTAAYPSDTLRIIDMIESFPSPPSRPPTKRRDRLHFFAPVPQRAPFAHFLGERASMTTPSASQD